MKPGPLSDYSPSAEPPLRSIWAVIGIVLAVVLVIGGLAFVGAMVLAVAGMNHWASNK